MKLFGSSDVSVDLGFLHAGYISAYPRPFGEMGMPVGASEPAVQLDLVEALRLQSETMAGALPEPSAVVGLSGPDGTISYLVAAVAVFGLAALASWARRQAPTLYGRLCPAAMAALLVLGALHCTETSGEDDALPTEPPWADLERQAYADPQAATLAILHGIVAPALYSIARTVDTLANLQDEVGLPTALPTPGMRYALAAYGLDGWGRELGFERTVTEARLVSYVVRSAGADGVLSNADDISVTVDLGQEGDWDSGWDQRINTFYLARHASEPALFIHRWAGELFEYNDQDLGSSLTAGGPFDVLIGETLEAAVGMGGGSTALIDEKLASFEGDEDGHAPLVMLAFE